MNLIYNISYRKNDDVIIIEHLSQNTKMSTKKASTVKLNSDKSIKNNKHVKSVKEESKIKLDSKLVKSDTIKKENDKIKPLVSDDVKSRKSLGDKHISNGEKSTEKLDSEKKNEILLGKDKSLKKKTSKKDKSSKKENLTIDENSTKKPKDKSQNKEDFATDDKSSKKKKSKKEKKKIKDERPDDRLTLGKKKFAATSGVASNKKRRVESAEARATRRRKLCALLAPHTRRPLVDYERLFVDTITYLYAANRHANYAGSAAEIEALKPQYEWNPNIDYGVYKLLQFVEDERPPYHGTFHKFSRSVTRRKPFGKVCSRLSSFSS